jgi:hypothetical protein
MRRLLATLLFGIFAAQTVHTAAMLDLNQTFTGNNTFSGPATFSGGITSTAPISSSATGVFTNTQQDLYFQSLVNGCNPTTEFGSLFTAQHATEAYTGCIAVPNSSTVFQTNTVAGYVNNQSGTATAGVALFGGARATTTNNGRIWGINTLAIDVPGVPSINIYGAEFDVNANNTGTITHGVLCSALFNVQPTDSRCFEVGQPKVGGFWPYGLYFNVGATQAPSNSGAGILFGPVSNNVNNVSQGMTFISKDPVSGNNFVFVNSLANGNLSIQTTKAGAGLLLGTAGNPFVLTEGTVPSGAAGLDSCYGDSTAHALKCSFNNGTFFQVAQEITATSSAFATATTAGTCVHNTTSVTGATTSMAVVVSPVSTPGVGAVWSGFVSSSGNVTINECAVAASAGGTIAFNIRVIP